MSKSSCAACPPPSPSTPPWFLYCGKWESSSEKLLAGVTLVSLALLTCSKELLPLREASISVSSYQVILQKLLWVYTVRTKKIPRWSLMRRSANIIILKWNKKQILKGLGNFHYLCSFGQYKNAKESSKLLFLLFLNALNVFNYLLWAPAWKQSCVGWWGGKKTRLKYTWQPPCCYWLILSSQCAQKAAA